MAHKITLPHLQSLKSKGERITMLTAYDATFTKILDEAGIEIILVGDSLGMVIQGHSNTLSVTIDQMIYHSQCVARGITKSHLVVDLPFMSYQISVEEALRNSGRIIKEGQAEAVKLEGGYEIAPTVEKLVQAGIPVMGHIGLQPMHVHQMGGYKVQGREAEAQKRLLQDAQVLEQAGAYALVLEGIPQSLAQNITKKLKIPTIGIGSGPHCDGQVLVSYDLFGLFQKLKPKFVKNYLNGFELATEALKQYIGEVKDGIYPSEAHSFT